MTALVYMDQLLALAHKSVQSTCKVKGLGENVQCTTTKCWFCHILEMGKYSYSSCNYCPMFFNNNVKFCFLLCHQICSNSQFADKWCCSLLNAGDLMKASSILFSRNNYSKKELFSNFLRMGFPSVSRFTRLQRQYLVPSIDELWSEKQRYGSGVKEKGPNSPW